MSINSAVKYHFLGVEGNGANVVALRKETDEEKNKDTETKIPYIKLGSLILLGALPIVNCSMDKHQSRFHQV